MIVRSGEDKLSVEIVAEQEGVNVANRVKRISDNIDPVLLAYEGLEVINETGLDLKVKLVLVKSTNRMFFYIEDIPCKCSPISYADQQKEYLEGSRVINCGNRGAPLDKVPIMESEY